MGLFQEQNTVSDLDACSHWRENGLQAFHYLKLWMYEIVESCGFETCKAAYLNAQCN